MNGSSAGPSRRSIIDSPDVSDLRVEAVLSQLLENDRSFTLTSSGREMFNPHLPEALYSDHVLRHIANRAMGGMEWIDTTTWIKHFLELVLDDSVVTPILDSAEAVVMEKADNWGIRTRTFEMLLGAFIIDKAVSRQILHFDRARHMISVGTIGAEALVM